MRTVFKSVAAASVLAAGIATSAAPANASADPFVGELMLAGFNFCPRGWAPAEGQLLSINSNQALFSLYGTTYGGDGRNTFGLPDLRGRAPLSQGTGPGLSQVNLGQKSGVEQVTLTVNQLPNHNHAATAVSTLHATSNTANQNAAENGILASSSSFGGTPLYHAAPPDVALDASSVSTTVDVGNSGGGQAVGIRNPFLGMQWCVSLQGNYPPRN
jgi:microcystin-dependent protein